MTKNELELFAKDKTYLASIVTAHKEGENIKTIIQNNSATIAKSDIQAKSQSVNLWLKKERIWD